MSEYFDIKVTDVEENEDGSAVVTIEMCEKARELLIEAGFVSLLKKHIDEIERSTDD
jgi:hypothetical protein